MFEELFEKGRGYLDQAGVSATEATRLSEISGYGSVLGGVINYGILSNEKKFAKNQAAAIELQAQQRTNILLESFNQSMGNLQYGATRRGVKAGEGSVMRNIELSGRDLGKDTAKAKREARIKAKGVKAQSRVNFASGLAGNILDTGLSLTKQKMFRKSLAEEITG